jgi:hypothetical protein
MITAGAVLLVQSLALELYAAHTSHSHDLPRPLPDLLAGMASLVGIDAAADGASIIMQSMRQTHRLAATWELFFDPATWLFFFGGLTMLGVKLSAKTRAWPTWISGLRRLSLIVALWLPMRAVLLMAVYLHRVLRFDPDQPLHAMNHIFSPWTLLLLLVVPVLLAWRFLQIRGRGTGYEENETGRLGDWETGTPEGTESPSLQVSKSPGLLVCCVCVAAAVALFTAAVYWNPSGAAKGDRVMVIERHSHWSPTTQPYDTKWFVEPKLAGEGDEGSGYNYARIYRYLEQRFEMSRLLESDAIDEKTLEKCDVLIIKIPTERYAPDEAAAVAQFVERGGSLLLIGDHANFKQSSTAMNDITRPMGFVFRNDVLFSFGASPYEQLFARSPMAHPALNYVLSMDFAVSCSIDPGTSRGREVIGNTGLWSMEPDYHLDNFHPVPQHCPEMRAGAFVQAWAADYGRGRVIAFADSTVFSNFCVGQPGKSEMMLGIVAWLCHAQPWLDPRPWLILLGLVPLAAVVRFDFRQDEKNEKADFRARWMRFAAAGTCGWTLASLAILGGESWNSIDLKQRHPQRCVVIDRTASNVPLSNGLYTTGGGEGYGLLEQWIARLDCWTVRREDGESFSGDVLAVICPSRSVSETYRQRLEQYVSGGGKLLVIDSPENANSTADFLLNPFGLSIRHDNDNSVNGRLTTALKKLPKSDVASACEVIGGQAIARVGATTVAAVAKHGRGSVMAVGFGSLWNDRGMGETWKTGGLGDDAPKHAGRAETPGWMLEPDATVKARYDVLFGLFGRFFEDADWPALPPFKPETDGENQNFEPKESGPAEL